MNRLAQIFKNHFIIYLFAFAMIATIVFLALRYMTTSSAASFQAGNIMSDYVMSNYNSMTEAEIQSFLKSKNSCNNTNYSNYVKYTNLGYTYHWKDGHFVCMADESFDGETAAHIIWQAAQDYKINPQVLIVLLQKEQGLVTDTWPNSNQYAKATGFACPDSGSGCDPYQGGFKNQIRKAANLFRTVLDGGWSNYPAYTTTYIQYNPNTACGGSNVYIQNRATSALYRYTPYQPNSSVPLNSYGTGDSCGAYGNRNFYKYFTDWFGDPTATITVSSNIVLPDGEYTIQSVVNNAYSVDVDNASTDDGANVQIWSNNNSTAQKFYLEYNSTTKLYRIKNIGSGKSLDVYGASTAVGANVNQWSNNDSCAQQWGIIADGDNNYKIVSACSGLVLDLDNSQTKDGTNLTVWSDNSGKNQRWKLISTATPAVDEGTYTISSKNGLVIDVYGASHNEGANIQLWTSHNDSNQQKFALTRTADGLYKMKDLNSDKYIDVYGAVANNGSNIQLWSKNDSCAQKWAIQQNSDGYYILSTCGKDKALDDYSGALKSGDNINIWDKNSSSAQRWYFSTASSVVADNTYRIVYSQDPTRSLDINGASMDSGAVAQLWDNNNSGAQSFKVTLSDDGYYRIKNTLSGLYVDVYGAYTKSGTQVQQWTGNSTCAQKWEIKKENNTYRFVNACSGKSLDVNTGISKNGQKIQIWDNNNSGAQNWLLEEI